MVFLLLGLVPLAAHQSWVPGKSCHCSKQRGLPKHHQGLSRTPRKRDKVMPYLAASIFVAAEGMMLINSQRKALLGSLVLIWCFPLVLLIDISELLCIVDVQGMDSAGPGLNPKIQMYIQLLLSRCSCTQVSYECRNIYLSYKQVKLSFSWQMHACTYFSFGKEVGGWQNQTS